MIKVLHVLEISNLHSRLTSYYEVVSVVPSQLVGHAMANVPIPMVSAGDILSDFVSYRSIPCYETIW